MTKQAAERYALGAAGVVIIALTAGGFWLSYKQVADQRALDDADSPRTSPDLAHPTPQRKAGTQRTSPRRSTGPRYSTSRHRSTAPRRSRAHGSSRPCPAAVTGPAALITTARTAWGRAAPALTWLTAELSATEAQRILCVNPARLFDWTPSAAAVDDVVHE